MAAGIPASAVTFTELWTAARVEIEIFADPQITGADVGWMMVLVDDTTVTLRGNVADSESVRRAEAAARAAGAQSIRNELQVVSPPTERVGDNAVGDSLRRALRHEPHLKGSRIRGRVASGLVTLTGRVPDIPARALASRMARRVPGVKAVDNQLWTDQLGMIGRR